MKPVFSADMPIVMVYTCVVLFPKDSDITLLCGQNVSVSLGNDLECICCR